MENVKTDKKYQANGLTISPHILTKGGTAHIVYNGLLANSGADKLYAHIGFGCEWQDAIEYKMEKIATGFRVDVPISVGDTLNLCFKDNADNWDNNSGHNYSYNVRNG